jgi:hypothetical protein
MERLDPSEIIIGIGGNQSGGTAGPSRRIRRSVGLIAAQTAGQAGPGIGHGRNSIQRGLWDSRDSG